MIHPCLWAVHHLAGGNARTRSAWVDFDPHPSVHGASALRVALETVPHAVAGPWIMDVPFARLGSQRQRTRIPRNGSPPFPALSVYEFLEDAHPLSSQPGTEL